MTSYAPGDSPEAFLSTTEHFDKDTDQSMDKLNNVYTDIAKQVNSKEIARYELTEILTGQQFFDPSDTQKRRATYRKCYTFGAIVSGGGLGIPHGLTGVTMYTRIYGGCLWANGNFSPIPYTSILGGNGCIEVLIVGANISIVNGVAPLTAAIVSGFIVLEYLKN